MPQRVNVLSMASYSASALPRETLPPGVTKIGGSADYSVLVWRNVMILRTTGEIDEIFLKAALAGHHTALQFESSGYGVVAIVESGSRLPNAAIRDKASELRVKTQHMLRAQSVILGGEGFFASTMRAVMTGILSLAQSRVPLKMVGGELEAASFLIEKGACDSGARIEDLHAVLCAIRST